MVFALGFLVCYSVICTLSVMSCLSEIEELQKRLEPISVCKCEDCDCE